MAVKKIELEEVAALTKELFHAHYAGDLEQWFSYLCPDSVYLGTGEPLLFGGDAIREHFKGFSGKAINIIQEEYFPLSLSDNAVQVCGQIFLESLEKSFRIINRFTISYRIIGGELKMVHQHNTYEYMQPSESRILNLDMIPCSLSAVCFWIVPPGGVCRYAAGHRPFLSIRIRFYMYRASAGKPSSSVLTE